MSIGASAIRAGLAVVELGADLTPLMAAMNKAASMLKSFSGQVTRIGASVGGLGAALAGPILASFKGAVDDAAAMDTLATQLSTTTDKASRLAYALGTVGISQDELIGFTRHLNNKFAEAASNIGDVRQEFAAFGVDIDALATKDATERFLEMHAAIQRITRDSDRSNKAQMLGRRGMELLKLSTEELRKRMLEAQDVGAVIDPEQAARAKEIQRSFDMIGSSVKYAMLEVGRALLPASKDIKEFAKQIVDAAKVARTLVSQNKPLVVGVLAFGAALTAAGAALVAFGVIGASVAGIVSGLTTAFGASLLILTPWGIGIATALAAVALVVGGLALAYQHASDEQRKFMRTGLFGDVADRWGEVAAEGAKAWDTIRESGVAAWRGISSALKRGDLSTAWAIVMAEADVIWQQSKASFLALWGDARDAFLTIADTIALGLQVTLTEAFAAVAKAFADLVGQITGTIARMLSVLATTRAAKLAGQSGNMQELADKIGRVGGDNGGIEAWKQKRIEAAKQAFDDAKRARDDARDHDREMREADVKMARERMQAILDEEDRAAALDAALAARNAGGGGGLAGASQAAREVRGSFAGFTSASAQQALAVGSTPVQRQLVDVNKAQLTELQEIKAELKNGGPAFG